MVRDRVGDRRSERYDKETISVAILSAVAAREGVEAHELKEPLYDAIDPDALETLFQNSTGQVTFEYLDYVVTVDHERNVEVNSPESR